MKFGHLSPAEFVSLQMAAQPSLEDQEVLDFARGIEFQPGAPIDQGWVDYFSQDYCHAFAMAANEAFSGTHFVVVTDPYDLAYEADDPDDNLPAVVHVYAIIEHEGRDWALDVFGMRPAASIPSEVVERYAAGIVSCDEASLPDLQRLIQNPQSPDPAQAFRPLAEVTESIMDRTRTHVAEVFDQLMLERQAGPAPR